MLVFLSLYFVVQALQKPSGYVAFSRIPSTSSGQAYNNKTTSPKCGTYF